MAYSHLDGKLAFYDYDKKEWVVISLGQFSARNI